MESTMEVQEKAGQTLTISEPSAPRPILFTLPCPRLLPALVSAGLMYLSFYPVGCGWLAWIALVPLLYLVRAEGRARNIYFAAWVSGLAFYWPVLQWMRVADYRMYYCWGLLATYCSCYVPLAIFLLRRLDRRANLPLVIGVPAVWVGLEYVRSFMLDGFPWYYLGHSQHTLLPLIQIADVTGVYGVSCLVAAANAVVFELLYTRRELRSFLRLAEPGDGQVRKPNLRGHFRPGRWLELQWVGLVLCLAGTVAYGFWRLSQADFETGPRVALLQGNVDQRLRNSQDDNDEVEAIKQHWTLCSIALRVHARPDLLVWPETSFPIPILGISPEMDIAKLPAAWRDEALSRQEQIRTLVTTKFPADHLLGLNSLILDREGKPRHYNSAWLLKADGSFAERYDKIHCLPFGEYVPFRDWLPFMNWFAPYDYDYSVRSGERQTRLKLGDFHYGVLICYEDTDPVLARKLAVSNSDGPAADFIVNMSNEGWFDDTCEHEEHLAICRFRAIECRRTLARAVNMGISAVIDGNGRVLAPELIWQSVPEKKNEVTLSAANVEYHAWTVTPHKGELPELPPAKWGEFKNVAGVLTVALPIDRRTSLYARLGDLLPLICCLVVVVGLVVSRIKWKQRPATDGAML